MLREVDQFYLNHEEPTRSFLLAVKEIVLRYDSGITHEWKYKLPFFCYHGKMLCYIWFHQKLKRYYLGFYHGNLINDPDLLAENRSKIKILLLSEQDDIPVEKINNILAIAVNLYHSQFSKD